MFKNIILNISIVIILLSLPFIHGTNAFYTDQKSITGNSFSTGWWVSPTVKVTSPDGGEMWEGGSTHDITWTATSSDPAGTITKVDILLSTDGGATYPITLISGLTNNGSYSWMIGDPKSPNMKVKVIATDNHDLVGSDESDNAFDPSPNPDPTATIVNPVIAEASAQLTPATPATDSATTIDTNTTNSVAPTPTPTPDETEVTPTPAPQEQTTPADTPPTTDQESNSDAAGTNQQ